jgi:hypothetical protein
MGVKWVDRVGKRAYKESVFQVKKEIPFERSRT